MTRSGIAGVGLAVVLLAGAGCGGGPSQAERAACRAASGLLAASDRETLRRRVDAMVSQSGRSGNDTLEEAARAYEAALDGRSQGDAAAAVGRFYDECERLGLEVPGGSG